MQPRKAKADPTITEAAEKTGVAIRELQSRLMEQDSGGETVSLERQLQAYFEQWPRESSLGSGTLNRIRDRVISGVAERILRGWENSQDGKLGAIENEVTVRLIERV